MCFVRDLLRRKPADVWTIGPRDSAYKALELMAEKDVGALPVVDAASGGPVVGIFSERDYARKVILKGKSSQATAVSEIMSSPVICVSPSDDVEAAMHLMNEHHIRHLPVVEGGRLIGLVSIGDILRAIIVEKNVLIMDLENFIVGARS
jgi:CBS domain-containing protein